MKNPQNYSQEAFFDMYIPEDAFVSNFSMKIKDKTYVAKVETKKDAETIFENSESNAGLVQNQEQSDFKETNHVRNKQYNICTIFSSKFTTYPSKYFRLLSQQNLILMIKLFSN